MTIRLIKIGTATGNTTATSDPIINGLVRGFYVDYTVTPNAATDVTIATVNTPALTILTITNNGTSGWYFPYAIMQDQAAATVTYDGTNEVYAPIPVSDYIKFTVADGDTDQITAVWVAVEC